MFRLRINFLAPLKEIGCNCILGLTCTAQIVRAFRLQFKQPGMSNESSYYQLQLGASQKIWKMTLVKAFWAG